MNPVQAIHMYAKTVEKEKHKTQTNNVFVRNKVTESMKKELALHVRLKIANIAMKIKMKDAFSALKILRKLVENVSVIIMDASALQKIVRNALILL